MGEHFHATGILSIDAQPSVFRPPGYPVFVAAVLRVRDLVSPGRESPRAVALAQGCLLSLGALALYLHSTRDRSLLVALAMGFLYAFHPLNLALSRAVTYPALHVLCVTVATLALTVALRSRTRRLPWALAAGALWGIATLVRPLSLLLPPFVLLLARWDGGRGRGRSALRFTALFTLGMAIVIGPYSVRNYRLTHRLIAVNAQEGWALWGLSAVANPAGGGGEWVRIWAAEGEPLFKRVTGSAYSIEVLYEKAVPLNDAFRAEAGRNIARDPGRFIGNLLINLYLFNADAMTWRWIRTVHEAAQAHWPGPARVFTVGTLLLGLAGVVRGLRDGDTHARVLVTIYTMFCVAHAPALLVPRYNYVRLPLVLLAIPLLVRDSKPWAVVLALLAVAASILEFSNPDSLPPGTLRRILTAIR